MIVDPARAFPRAARTRVLVLVCCSLCLLIPGAALAFQLPLEGNHPNDMAYDLASMTLMPHDYGIDGLARTESHLMGPGWFAEYFAAETGADPDDMADEFDDAGLRAVFLALAGRPSEDDPDEYGIATQSTALEFEDEDGAEAGFELLQIETPGAEEIDAPEVGDESILIRVEAEEAGRDYILVGYVFRVDNIIGVVELLWMEEAMGDEFAPDEIADLASEMEDRTDDALAGETSGINMKLLRLDGGEDLPIRTVYDEIDMVNGFFLPPYGVSEEVYDPIQELWIDAGMVNSQRLAISFVPNGDENDPGAVFLTRIYEFGSRREARSFVGDAAGNFIGQADTGGYSEVEQVDELPDVEGEVAVISYTYDFGGDDLTSGYRIWMQVDNYVVSLEADSTGGADLDTLYDLLDEQVSCVEDEGYCRPVEVPEGLFG
jgi:hypothetical protein